MLLRQEVTDGVEVLCALGPMSDREAARLLSAVESALSLHPRAVVVDLVQVQPLTDGARSLLTALPRLPAGWPLPSLVVCPPVEAPDLPGLVLAADREDALAHVDDRPPRVCERIPLEPGGTAPAQARAAVSRCRERLGLDEVHDDVLLIVSELVTNAVRHAVPPVCLEIESSPRDIIVSVRDGSPQRPSPRDAEDDDEGGRGMLLVDLLAADHGVRAQPPGKAVWARLRRREPAAEAAGRTLPGVLG